VPISISIGREGLPRGRSPDAANGRQRRHRDILDARDRSAGLQSNLTMLDGALWALRWLVAASDFGMRVAMTRLVGTRAFAPAPQWRAAWESAAISTTRFPFLRSYATARRYPDSLGRVNFPGRGSDSMAWLRRDPSPFVRSSFFLAWVELRPREGRWELIGGVALDAGAAAP